MSTRARIRLGVAALAVAGAIAVGCSGVGTEPPPQVPGGNPRAGAQQIVAHGCGACHMIPGIKGANGLVGPPLIHWSRRGYIAGELTNNANNLIRWITDPRAVEPGTDMPNTGVTAAEARDIAAYLYTLH